MLAILPPSIGVACGGRSSGWILALEPLDGEAGNRPKYVVELFRDLVADALGPFRRDHLLGDLGELGTPFVPYIRNGHALGLGELDAGLVVDLAASQPPTENGGAISSTTFFRSAGRRSQLRRLTTV